MNLKANFLSGTPKVADTNLNFWIQKAIATLSHHLLELVTKYT